MAAANKAIALPILATLIISLCSCASGPDLTRVAVGMDKAQVIQRLGKPLTANASGSTEQLVYGWNDSMWDGRVGERHWYVQLANNRVVGYGEVPLTEVQIMANSMEKAAALGAIGRASASMQQQSAQQAQFAHEEYMESQRALNRSFERMTPQKVEVRIR